MPSTPPSPIGIPVLPGVGWIRGPLANVFVFRDGSGTYLIDAGFPDSARPIVAEFRRAGVPLSECKQVLLTHQHPDHMGGAAFLRWSAGSRIACHAMDTPTVEGRGPMFAPLLVRLLFRRHPVQVDRVLKAGDTVGPFTVVHVPGHTLGSVAFHHAERKLLFAGDAVVTGSRGVGLAAGFSNFDEDTAIQSVEKLSQLPVEAIFAGHGRPVLSGGAALLKEAARRLSARPQREWWTLAGPEGMPETHPRPSHPGETP